MEYQNIQRYHECQLVSLWNAARFYEKDNIPLIDSKEYIKAIENCYCINGACINIDKEIEKIELRKVYGKLKLNWVRYNLPVEFNLYCHRGFHSTLAIKVKQNKILLTNYAWNKLYWLKWDQIKKRQGEHKQLFKYIGIR